MKKGKVFTSSHIALGLMVLVLSAAVLFNMKYSSAKSGKYMGETTFVDGQTENSSALAVNGQIEQDYFEKAKSDREKSYKEAEEIIKETLLNASQDQKAKEIAAEKAANLAKRKTDEVALENLLSAKGFKSVLVVIGEESVTVIIKKDALSAEETVQIQDAVMSQCDISLSSIKIFTVNS